MVIHNVGVLTPAEIEENLRTDVYENYAFQVNDHHYDGEYNFLESQRDREFVRSIAGAFGNSNAVCLDIVKGQQDVDIDLEDGDLREDDGTLRVHQTKGWIDILIESGEQAIWEMKSPNRPNGQENTLTQDNWLQLFQYWQAMPMPRPRYLVLCNFRTFRLWDTNNPLGEHTQPEYEFGLEDICDYAHLFPYFDTQNPNQLILDEGGEISERTGVALGRFYHNLVNSGIDQDIAVRFAIKSALIMYLEDFRDRDGLPIIPRDMNGRGIFFGTLLAARNAFEEGNPQLAVASLFTLMNEFGHENEGIFNVPLISEEWFNGEEVTPPFPISFEQINLLINCASYNWRNLEPMILGSFVEQCFTNAQRLAGGIHFTRENDVMLIVQPLIVDYFRRRIDNVGGGHNQRYNQYNTILEDVQNFSVLEPAVGGGNFLYIAYRELRRIEDEIITLIRQLPNRNSWLPITRLNAGNLHGLEYQPWSSWVARLTMAIGKCRLELNSNLPTHFLPLEEGDCSAQIITCDALLDGNGIREWPEVNVIIGNPPFCGTTVLRQRRGRNYVDNLHDVFAEADLLPRRDIDYVGYWFILAQRHLLNNQCSAFGFISTRALVQRQSRTVLRYGLDNDLRISLAYRDRPWEGSAGVHIAITCMERNDHAHVEGTWLASALNADLVESDTEINEFLSNDDNFYILFESLNDNAGISRQSIKGPYRGSQGGSEPGFEDLMRSRSLMLGNEVAEAMRNAQNLDESLSNEDVVVRYIPNSYWERRESEWIINFRNFDEAQASNYLQPWQHLHDNGRRDAIIHNCTEMIPDPESGELRDNRNYSAEYAEQNFDQRWWQIWRNRENETFHELRQQGMYYVKSQLLNMPSNNGHIHFERVEGNSIADGGMYILNLNEDWHIGVLLSDFHQSWCRYTHGFNATGGDTWFPSEVLDGFPMPQDVSNEDVGSLNVAISNYYQYLDDLFNHDDTETLRDCIDHPTLDVRRTAISRIVRRMYGLPEHGEVTYEQLIAIKISQWVPEEIARLNDISQIMQIARVGQATVDSLSAQGWTNITLLSQTNAQQISENTPRFSLEQASEVLELVTNSLIPEIQHLENLV